MTTATMPATPDASAPRRRGRVLLVAVAAAVLAIGGGAALLLLGTEATADEEAGPVEDGPVVPVAEMTATLAGPHIHYAKLSFSAVLTPKADEAAVAARFPLLRDAAITELSTITADHLRTTVGMDELRARLSAKATEIFPDGEVLRILFTELVVQ